MPYNTVMAVVAVLVVVIVILSIALVLKTGEEGGGIDGGNGGDGGTVTMTVSTPSISYRPVDQEAHWDAAMAVVAIVPEGEHVNWSELSMVVMDSHGTLLLGDTPLAKSDIEEVDDTTPVMVQAWYNDIEGEASEVDPQDIIALTGLDAEYQGATVKLMSGTECIAQAVLPVDFVEHVPITVTLANPDTNKGTGNRSSVWDTTLNIQKMTPPEKKVLWTEARLIIKSATGSVLLPSTALSADNRSAYDDTSPFTVEVWYVETTTGDTKMSAGDAIKITGMEQSYEGATIEILRGGKRIGQATLTTNFP